MLSIFAFLLVLTSPLFFAFGEEKKYVSSYSKNNLYISICNEDYIFSGDDPENWKSCDDANEFTWELDQGSHLTYLTNIDKVKLKRSSGFCPHRYFWLF